MNPLLGTPTFRWLPARARIQTGFLLVETKVPEGFTRIDEVTLEGGKLAIIDGSAASRGLKTAKTFWG